MIYIHIIKISQLYIKQYTGATACEHIQSAFRSGAWHHAPDLLGKKAGWHRLKAGQRVWEYRPWHSSGGKDSIQFIRVAYKE